MGLINARTRSARWAAGAVALAALAAGTGVAHAEDVEGTPDNDRLVGTSGSDNIYGLAGGDDIDGAGGGDRLYGGEGDDIVYSRRNVQQSEVYGEAGDDEVVGWRFDKIYGGEGDDTLYFWEQRTGGKAVCGAGFDTLILTRGVPQKIKIKGCERIRTRPGGSVRLAH